MGFWKNPLLDPQKSEMGRSAIFKIDMTSLDKISQTGADWHADCGDMIEIETGSRVEFQYDGRLGEFNGMSSQSNVPHCRVLPPGESNAMISQPHWKSFFALFFIFGFPNAVWAWASGGFCIVSHTLSLASTVFI